MNNKILKILNPLLFLLVVNQAVTGMLHDKMTPEVFDYVHFMSGILLSVLIVAHIVLNWGWIKQQYFKRINKK